MRRTKSALPCLSRKIQRWLIGRIGATILLYLALAIARQSNSDITEHELSDVIKLMLSASINTKSSLLGWNLYHVAAAANQEVQQRLYKYQELASAVAKEENVAITKNVSRKSTYP
jgi:hypothetical protein